MYEDLELEDMLGEGEEDTHQLISPSPDSSPALSQSDSQLSLSGTLPDRKMTREESYEMRYPSPPPEENDDLTVASGMNETDRGGESSCGGDDQSLATSIYPEINFENSSVILDPRNDMVVVAEGPVDEDMQRAWLATLEDGRGGDRGNVSALDREQRAGWYDSNSTMPAKIIPHHIPVPAKEDLDVIEGTFCLNYLLN